MRQLPRWLPALWQAPLLQLAQMPLGRRLVRGAAASLVMTAVSIVLGIASSILLGRSLGPQQYGLYSFVLILVTVATVPIWYGMSMLLTRETGRMMASGKRGEMTELLRWAFGWSATASLAITIAAALMLWLSWGWLDAARAGVCLVGLPLIAASIFQPLTSSILRGLGGLVRSQFADLVARPALSLSLLLTTIVVIGPRLLTAQAAIVISIVAVVAASALSGYWLVLGWRELPVEGRSEANAYVPAYRLSNLVAFSAFAALSSVYNSIDSLMLDGLSGDAALGIYRIALTGIQLVGSLTAAVNTISQPSIARLHAIGDRDRLQRLLTVNARATLLLAVVPVVVLVLFGAPLLRLVFGEPFAAGAPALAICAAGQLAAALAGPVWNVLSMTGHERPALRFLSIATIVNLTLCALLIPAFGMTGAAISTTTGSLVFTALMSLNERRWAGVTSSVFGAR